MIEICSAIRVESVVKEFIVVPKKVYFCWILSWTFRLAPTHANCEAHDESERKKTRFIALFIIRFFGVDIDKRSRALKAPMLSPNDTSKSKNDKSAWHFARFQRCVIFDVEICEHICIGWGGAWKTSKITLLRQEKSSDVNQDRKNSFHIIKVV